MIPTDSELHCNLMLTLNLSLSSIMKARNFELFTHSKIESLKKL